jgi:hypothetical protein
MKSLPHHSSSSYPSQSQQQLNSIIDTFPSLQTQIARATEDAMPTKVFITGITGYIGGDAFHVLSQEHPDFEYAALIRTQEKADYVKGLYPNLRVVIGSNDDSEIITKESAWADIVLRKTPPSN